MNVKRMEAQLKVWRAQIDELAVKAEKAGPRAGFDQRQRIDDIKAKCALLQSQLDKLRAARP